MLKSKQHEPESRKQEPGVGDSRSSNSINNSRRRRKFSCLLFAGCCLLFAAGCRQDMQDQPRYEVYEPTTFFKDGLASRSLVEGTVARGHLRADTELYTGKIDRSQTGSTSGQQNTGGRTAGDDAAQPAGQSGTPQNSVDNRGAVESRGATAGQGTPNTPAQAGGGTAAAPGDPDAVEVFPFQITEEIVTRGQERYEIFCAMCHGATGYGDGMIVRRGFRKPPAYHTEELRNARVGHLFDVISNGWGSMPSYREQIPVRDRWAIIAYIRALQLSQQGVTAQNAATPTTTTPNTATGAQPPHTGGAK